MKRLIYFLVITLLLLIAFLAFYTRMNVLDVPLEPENFRGSWEVELRFRADAGETSARVKLALPQTFSQIELNEEHFQFSGFSVGIFEQDGYRYANLTRPRRDVEQEEHFYRFVVSKKSPSSISLHSYGDKPAEFDDEELLQKILQQVKKYDLGEDKVAEQLVLLLHSPGLSSFKLAREERQKIRDFNNEQRLSLLSSLGIEALYRYGIILEKTERSTSLKKALLFRTEEEGKKGPIRFFVEASSQFVQNGTFVPWGGQSSPIDTIRGFENIKTQIATIPKGIAVASMSNAKSQEAGFLVRAIEFTSFDRLSVHSQTIFRVLLLLPLAALIITFLRNVIGLQTFGTFMPALLALGFRETGLLVGFLLALGVIVVGVGCRFLFQRLQLLMVPRLTAILTSVVMAFYLISLSSVGLDVFYGLEAIALFPVVVLTMMVERLSIVVEELGVKKGVVQTIATLIGTICAYLIVTQDRMMYLFSSFPELLLIVLACSLLLGRYTGFRLSELYRFRKLRRVL